MGIFSGHSFLTKGLSISHLQFADDTLLVGEINYQNVWVIKSLLQVFDLVFGLKVNFHKSSLMGIHISELWLAKAAHFLNCRIGNIPFLYLGLPMGAATRRLSIWQQVVDKV